MPLHVLKHALITASPLGLSDLQKPLTDPLTTLQSPPSLSDAHRLPDPLRNPQWRLTSPERPQMFPTEPQSPHDPSKKTPFSRFSPSPASMPHTKKPRAAAQAPPHLRKSPNGAERSRKEPKGAERSQLGGGGGSRRRPEKPERNRKFPKEFCG